MEKFNICGHTCTVKSATRNRNNVVRYKLSCTCCKAPHKLTVECTELDLPILVERQTQIEKAAKKAKKNSLLKLVTCAHRWPDDAGVGSTIECSKCGLKSLVNSNGEIDVYVKAT